jgi:hypothetical protein
MTTKEETFSRNEIMVTIISVLGLTICAFVIPIILRGLMK